MSHFWKVQTLGTWENINTIGHQHFYFFSQLNNQNYTSWHNFFYEDGQENAVNENERPEPMDYIVDHNLYALESLTSHTEYLQNVNSTSTAQVVENLDYEREQRDEDSHMREITEERA